MVWVRSLTVYVFRYSVLLQNLTPLIFSFELPIMGASQRTPDATSPYVVKIQEKYNVQVMLRTRPKLHATLVLVKGCEWEVSQVKEATVLLIHYMCENLAVSNHLFRNTFLPLYISFYSILTFFYPLISFLFSFFIVIVIVIIIIIVTIQSQIQVQMSMEISPHHHSIVLGKSSSNLKMIMQRTSTQIMFPDASDPNIPSLKKSNVTIIGGIHNVYLARQQLVVSMNLS